KRFRLGVGEVEDPAAVQPVLEVEVGQTQRMLSSQGRLNVGTEHGVQHGQSYRWWHRAPSCGSVLRVDRVVASESSIRHGHTRATSDGFGLNPESHPAEAGRAGR